MAPARGARQLEDTVLIGRDGLEVLRLPSRLPEARTGLEPRHRFAALVHDDPLDHARGLQGGRPRASLAGDEFDRRTNLAERVQEGTKLGRPGGEHPDLVVPVGSVNTCFRLQRCAMLLS